MWTSLSCSDGEDDVKSADCSVSFCRFCSLLEKTNFIIIRKHWSTQSRRWARFGPYESNSSVTAVRRREKLTGRQAAVRQILSEPLH